MNYLSTVETIKYSTENGLASINNTERKIKFTDATAQVRNVTRCKWGIFQNDQLEKATQSLTIENRQMQKKAPLPLGEE